MVRLASFRKDFGQVSHKWNKACDNIFEVDQAHLSHKRNTGHFVIVGIKTEDFKLCSKMALLQVICKTPSQHQEVFCIFSDPARFLKIDFLDVQEAICSVPQQCRIGNPVAGCRFYS